MSDLIRREDVLKALWNESWQETYDIIRALPAVQPGHVNETPKNEHDERVMLAPNAALLRGPA